MPIVIPESAYPLAWPENVPRTPFQEQKHSKFGRKLPGQWQLQPASSADGYGEIMRQLKNLRARTIVISTNLRPRVHLRVADGMPLEDAPSDLKGDAGVAVYWTRNENRGGRLQLVPYCMPCDHWRRLGDNLHAVGLSIEAMRGMERWGCVSIEQAFSGFAALPPGSGESVGHVPADLPWRLVLGAGREWPEGLAAAELLLIARSRYRTLVKEAHPDHGGTDELAASLNSAMAQAERELEG